MAKTITLKDIARETDVHVSTVSRALDDDLSKHLSPKVVAKIRKTAARMGYRRNRLASGLRTKRSMTIGLLIPDINNALFPPIVRGMEKILEKAGYASIIVNTDGDQKRELMLLETLMERGVDGIIDAATSMDAGIDAIVRQGLPVVTVNRQAGESTIPAVINDDVEGIRLALTHLYEKGHRRIAHIAGPQDLSTGINRLAAFKRGAADLGLSLSDSSIAVATRMDVHEGRQCTEQLLGHSRADRCTAILCANDRLALGALDQIRHHGLSCPKDISVTGFNDIPFLDLIPPGLSTIHVQQDALGRLAAEMLLRMLDDEDATIPRTTIMPVTLIKRGSVAPPPNLPSKNDL